MPVVGTGFMGDCIDIDECAMGRAVACFLRQLHRLIHMHLQDWIFRRWNNLRDIDECATNTDDCHPNAICTNSNEFHLHLSPGLIADHEPDTSISTGELIDALHDTLSSPCYTALAP